MIRETKSSDDVEAASGKCYVCWTAGSWCLAALGPTRVDPVGLDQVLEAIAGASERQRPATCRSDDPAPATPQDGWYAVGGHSWAGAIVPGGVEIESSSGAPFVLDALDLVILDRLVEARPLSDLRTLADRDEVDRHLVRLVAGGRVRFDGGPATTAADVPGSGAADAGGATPVGPEAHHQVGRIGRYAARAATAYRLSSRLAPVRRVLGGDPPSSSDEVAATAPDLDLVPGAEPIPEVEVVEVPADPCGTVGARDDGAHPDDHGPPGRVVVYAPWFAEAGPQLSLGMLTAAARHHRDGALAEVLEIRRPEEATQVLAGLAAGSGPAILLCSDYVWSLDANIELAREARMLRPQLVVIHGGPSSPRYPAAVDHFFEEYGDVADVLVRGEGEQTLCELLDALVVSDLALDRSVLEGIDGLTFRDPIGGEIVRTPDRTRQTQLDDLPSPYLTGEFDHVPGSAFRHTAAIETARGCPYGCTFCDWGSATNARIRRFGLDRVRGEIDWLTDRGVAHLMVADANFGITSRDRETADWLARRRAVTGFPEHVAWTPAKNTTKHLIPILETFLDAGIVSTVSLSMQTFDPDTLEAIERSNISLDHFLRLATDLRRRCIPLQADLMLGLPGQTVGSFRDDLQEIFDHEVQTRVWPVLSLPNAPMAEPGYVAEHGIEVNDRHVVVATSTFDRADRQEMLRLRRAYIAIESLGLLRHPLRWLQWEHGRPAVDVLSAMLDTTAATPERYPSLTWVTEVFDRVPGPLVGWSAFYEQFGSFVREVLGIETDDAGYRTVIAVQRALMPAPGRAFPSSVTLEHDWVAYYLEATECLFVDGRPGHPDAPLATRPPGVLTVAADPLGLCDGGLGPFGGRPGDELFQSDYFMLSGTAWELDSPLVRLLPEVVRRFPPDRVRAYRELRPDVLPELDVASSGPASVEVRLGRASERA